METDQPAHGTTAFVGSGLEPGQSMEKNWGVYPIDRDPEKRHLVFRVDPKSEVDEISDDNNSFVLDPWKSQLPDASSQDDP